MAVGNPVIDAQHRHIIDLINALHAAADGEGLETADTLIRHIERFLRHHFETEETLFNKIPYEQTADHRAEHQRLLDQVGQVALDAERTGRNKTDLYARQLWSLIHDHTVLWDRSYIPALHSWQGQI